MPRVARRRRGSILPLIVTGKSLMKRPFTVRRSISAFRSFAKLTITEPFVVSIDLKADEQHWIEVNARGAKEHPVQRTKLPPLELADERRRALGY